MYSIFIHINQTRYRINLPLNPAEKTSTGTCENEETDEMRSTVKNNIRSAFFLSSFNWRSIDMHTMENKLHGQVFLCASQQILSLLLRPISQITSLFFLICVAKIYFSTSSSCFCRHPPSPPPSHIILSFSNTRIPSLNPCRINIELGGF